MNWTVQISSLPDHLDKACEFRRSEKNNACGARTPERHSATHRIIYSKTSDGVVSETVTRYYCTNATCATRVRATESNVVVVQS